MTRDRLISFFFISLLIFIFYQVCLIFSAFFEPIFWACVLAFIFYPLYNRLLKKMGNHRTPAALLTLIIIFLTIIPLLAVILVYLAIETAKLYDFLWNAVESGRLRNLMDQLRQLPIVHRLESHEVLASFIRKNSENWLLNAAKSLGGFTARHIALITKNFLLFGLNLILTFFLSFFFLKDGNRIYRFIYEITPLDEHDKEHIFKQINDTFAAVIHGQVLTAIAQAIVAGIIFWALRLPLPIFFAALTFLAAFIPVMGASLVWGSFVIYLIALQHFHKAFVLFLLGIFVISLVDNFLKPFFIGEKTKLPYILLFLGILGGLGLYGFVGIFLAPAVISLFFALIRIYREKYFKIP